MFKTMKKLYQKVCEAVSTLPIELRFDPLGPLKNLMDAISVIGQMENKFLRTVPRTLTSRPTLTMLALNLLPMARAGTTCFELNDHDYALDHIGSSTAILNQLTSQCGIYDIGDHKACASFFIDTKDYCTGFFGGYFTTISWHNINNLDSCVDKILMNSCDRTYGTTEDWLATIGIFIGSLAVGSGIIYCMVARTRCCRQGEENYYVLADNGSENHIQPRVQLQEVKVEVKEEAAVIVKNPKSESKLVSLPSTFNGRYELLEHNIKEMLDLANQHKGKFGIPEIINKIKALRDSVEEFYNSHKDPVTLEIMQDPTMASSQHFYNIPSLLQLINSEHPYCALNPSWKLTERSGQPLCVNAPKQAEIRDGLDRFEKAYNDLYKYLMSAIANASFEKTQSASSNSASLTENCPETKIGNAISAYTTSSSSSNAYEARFFTLPAQDAASNAAVLDSMHAVSGVGR